MGTGDNQFDEMAGLFLDHLQQLFARVGSNFFQKPNKPSKMAEQVVNFCPNCNNSPNLVTRGPTKNGEAKRDQKRTNHFK